VKDKVRQAPIQDADKKWESSYELKFEFQVHVMRPELGRQSTLDCQVYVLVHTTPHLSDVPNTIMCVKPS